MSAYLRHRRFAEVFQTSTEWPGTIAQQEAVRIGLTPLFGTAYHELLKRLDRVVNGRGRSFLTVGFAPLGNYLGLAGAGGIVLNEIMTSPAVIIGQVRHEAGHVVDQLDLLTSEDRRAFQRAVAGDVGGDWLKEFQETWADAFRDWVASRGEQWPMVGVLLG